MGWVGLAGGGCEFHAATVVGHDWLFICVHQAHPVLLGDVLGHRFGLPARINKCRGDEVSALNYGAEMRIETGGDEDARGHDVT